MRTFGASYNGSMVGLPVGASIALMYWRRDVFANASLAPPRTWREVIEVARALNSTDFNNGAQWLWWWGGSVTMQRCRRWSFKHGCSWWHADGVRDHALCLDALRPPQLGDFVGRNDLITQILASITQSQVRVRAGMLHNANVLTCVKAQPTRLRAALRAYTRSCVQGTSTGWLFDPQTMKPFVDTPVSVSSSRGCAAPDNHAGGQPLPSVTPHRPYGRWGGWGCQCGGLAE